MIMKKTIEVEFAIDDAKAFTIGERLFDHFYNHKGILQITRCLSMFFLEI